ncbi:MAG: HigA family addiction module antitoxin [Aridibacter sp.]
MNKEIHIPSIHPGMILQDELEEISVSQSDLAEHIGVSTDFIIEICQGKRGIDAETAWKLSQSLGASPNFWLNLQNNWELSQVKPKLKEKLDLIAA